jgi:hypothetical protein
MKALQQTKTQLWILSGCCLLMVFIVKPWELYFLNDDFVHIPLDIRYLFERGGFMRPVPNLFLEIDKWLYGKNALGFFCTTLLLHFVCVFCVFIFCKKLVKHYLIGNGFELLAFYAAVLFCFYPFHTEALMWTICRVATIATIFTVLSLHFYLTATENKLHALLSWIFFAIALFTYESMWNVLLLYMFVAIANIKKGKPIKREASIWLVFLATFIAYLFIRVKVLSSLTGDGYDSFEENSTNIRLLMSNWIKLIARVFTPPFISTKAFVIFCASSMLTYVAAVFLLFRKEKKAGKLAIILILSIITGVATAAILGIDTHRGEADRYLYYASVFFCMILSILTIKLVTSIRIQILIISGFTIAFVIMLSSYQRNFSIASKATRTTVELIGRNPATGTAYFVGVPKAKGGALIFRVGLDAAVDWMSPQSGYKKVVVLSQIEQFDGNINYLYGDIDWKEFATKNNLATEKLEIRDDRANTIQLQENDAVYWFRNDGVFRVNLQVSK